MTQPDPDANRDPTHRVVLVDDEPDLRIILHKLLDHDGRFTVVGEAKDGYEALEVVAATQPDVVLLDLCMPVLDGRAALPRLREVAPSAVVIVFSGFVPPEPGHPTHPRHYGAHAAIRKRASVKEIPEEIAGILADLAHPAPTEAVDASGPALPA